MGTVWPVQSDHDESVSPEEGVGAAADAVEAAVEGVPGAVSLAPSAVMPALGGELVLPEGPPQTADGAPAAAADSVRHALVQAGPLALAGLVANGANVVVTILLARLLTNRGYGAYNQLAGLFLVVSMPGSAVIVAVVRRVTAWHGTATAELVRKWARVVHRRGTAAVIVFAILTIVVGPWLSQLLNQPSEAGLDAVLIAGAVWVLLCLDRGLLQAHQSYGTLAGNLLVEGGARTVGVLVLVGAGGGVAGAAFGMLIGELVTAVHARVAADRAWAVWSGDVAAGDTDGPAQAPDAPRLDGAGRHGSSGFGRWRELLRSDPSVAAAHVQRRDLVRDLGAAFVALALVALLQNIDVIVVGREAPGRSGSYAAVSVASKALVFGAIVLGGYLLPEAAIRWRRGGHALRQLGVTLLILAVPAGLLFVLAFGAPHLFLSLVFSARYLGAVSAFGPLVLAMICLSVTVILTMYLLAIGRRWISWILLVGGIALTAAVTLSHGRPRTTAVADLGVQAALAAAIVVSFALVHRRRFKAR